MKLSFSTYLSVLVILCALVSPLYSQQGSVEVFGKNRVQYSDDFDNWDRYESQHFVTHWYGKARGVAEAVVQYAEYENESIRSVLEHRTNVKTDIIVYADITDLHQSNIGDNEILQTRPGETKVYGNKLFVYFDGNQEHLRKQLRAGIAQVYLYQMLFGGNWKQFIQNIGHETYPQWYLDGIIAYIKSPWTLESDNIMRDIFQHDAYEDFYGLAQDYPELAGHLFWLYLSQKYGESIIANILYLNRISRNIDNAFIYALNVELEGLIELIWHHYAIVFKKDNSAMEMPPDDKLLHFRNKYCSSITELRRSPDGSHLAFISNELGKWKLYLYNYNTGKEKVLIKGSYRNPFQAPDLNYPMIEWKEKGNKIYLINEKQDVLRIKILDTLGKTLMEDVIAPPFERIYDFDIVDSNKLVLSAYAHGNVDLYHYYLNTRQMDRLTRDYYDDLDVTVGSWAGNKGYFYTSNRLNNATSRQVRDTSLVEENLDIYFLPISHLKKDSSAAIRITETDFNHLGLQYTDGNLYFLVENMGRRMLARIGNTGDTELISAWRSNLLSYNIHKDELTVALLDNGKEKIYKRLSYGSIPMDSVYRPSMSMVIHPYLVEGTESLEEVEKVEKGSRVSLVFQSEFPDPRNIPSFENIEVERFRPIIGMNKYISSRGSKENDVEKFHSPRVVASRLFFKTDGLDFNFTNKPLFTGLDSYAGQKQGYQFAPFGLLVTSRVYDVFEDYVFEGGARFPVQLNGSEYYLTFKNKKRRWDKIYGIYRKSEKHVISPQPGVVNGIQQRAINYIGTYEMRYPFDMFRSIRFRGTYRQDRFITKSTDNQTLPIPSENAQRLGLRVAYVFDNTYDMAFNMKSGMRYKIYSEVMNRFKIQFAPWNFKLNEGFMTVVGFDVRKYFRLGNHAMLGLRGAGATSFGSEQILFVMGGVENWLFPQYSNLSRPGEGNFVYRGLAANVRGFKQNVRNGSSYMLGNVELRVAPFNYFSKRELQSSFLRNFQVVGFLDLGTAWYGLSPYSDANPLNRTTIRNAIADIQLQYYRDPLIVGIGGGIRMMVFGMYLKADYAWGLDTKRIGKPILYISMGKDF